MSDEYYQRALDNVRKLNRERRLSPVASNGYPESFEKQSSLVLFSGNDYLGLSTHPAVKEAAVKAIADYGMGPRGSALMCGFTELHRALSEKLAALKGTASCVLFPTGYQANVGLLTALGTLGGTFFSDELNHASIVDGCRLARSAKVIYPHLDMCALEHALKACKTPLKIVITEEIFSMDGDGAKMEELALLKARYGFILVTDSAHSSGVYGPEGSGWANACGVSALADFQVGTLSKAYASQGGYVCCSHSAHAWLINTARPFIFSSALPVPVVASATKALDLSVRDPSHRKTLWQRVAQFQDAHPEVIGPIVPIIVGSETAALSLSEALMKSGFHVPAIRPPTVPKGRCRIRIALSAGHRVQDVSMLLEALNECEKNRLEQDC